MASASFCQMMFLLSCQLFQMLCSTRRKHNWKHYDLGLGMISSHAIVAYPANNMFPDCLTLRVCRHPLSDMEQSTEVALSLENSWPYFNVHDRRHKSQSERLLFVHRILLYRCVYRCELLMALPISGCYYVDFIPFIIHCLYDGHKCVFSRKCKCWLLGFVIIAGQ